MSGSKDREIEEAAVSGEIELFRRGPSNSGDVAPLPSPADDEPGVMRVIEFTLPPWTRQYARLYRERVRALEQAAEEHTVGDVSHHGSAPAPQAQNYDIRPTAVVPRLAQGSDGRLDARLNRVEHELSHGRFVTGRIMVGLVAALVLLLVAFLRQYLDFGAAPPALEAASPLQNEPVNENRLEPRPFAGSAVVAVTPAPSDALQDKPATRDVASPSTPRNSGALRETKDSIGTKGRARATGARSTTSSESSATSASHLLRKFQ